MLDHIHPSLRRFACKARPILNGLVTPGSVSRTIQGPPRVQSPFARLRRYLFRRDVFCTSSEGVTPPSSLLRTHAPVQYSPVLFGSPYSTGLCRLSPAPAGLWSFPTLSLQSLPRCLDPYPAAFSGCLCSFLPMESSVFSNLSLDRLSHYAPVKRLLTGPRFRGCSHSVMFRPPRLLVTLVAPTLIPLAAVTFPSEHLMIRYLIMPRIC